MSTETHTEAGRLAEELETALASDDAEIISMLNAAAGSTLIHAHLAGNIVHPAAQVAAEAALSYLTARLTDDDVVEAAGEAIYDTPLYMASGGNATEAGRLARASLAAAADVIGGER